MEQSPIIMRNSSKEWSVALALCAAATAFMLVYHDWWRGKTYSWVTLNETIAQGAFFGLCAALSLGPLSRFFPRLFGPCIAMRRAFGVSSVLFAIAHILIALIPLWSKFGWKYFSEHILMLCLGACAALILFVLGSLSFKRTFDRIGVERWRSVQKLGYLVVVLACAHFLVLGKLSGWAEWFRTMDHPAPPGSLPVCVLGAVPLLLKGVELVRARQGQDA